ncbi:hypothetical protein BD309DRAFT_362468 [Dichomitus squalens]|nr:hypothetical protein BD309DRAFT_362468 [Dichomitus squalens]
MLRGRATVVIEPPNCRVDWDGKSGSAADLTPEPITIVTYMSTPRSSTATRQILNRSHHLCLHLQSASVISRLHYRRSERILDCSHHQCLGGVSQWASGAEVGHFGIGAHAAVRARWLRATCMYLPAEDQRKASLDGLCAALALTSPLQSC